MSLNHLDFAAEFARLATEGRPDSSTEARRREGSLRPGHGRRRRTLGQPRWYDGDRDRLDRRFHCRAPGWDGDARPWPVLRRAGRSGASRHFEGRRRGHPVHGRSRQTPGTHSGEPGTSGYVQSERTSGMRITSGGAPRRSSDQADVPTSSTSGTGQVVRARFHPDPERLSAPAPPPS